MVVRSSFHKHLIASVGARIVEDELPAGTVLRSVDLGAEYGVSLTVVRESLRALEVMRLVKVKPSMGIMVRDRSEWSYLDSRVIEWRFAASNRAEQLRSLRELRAAVIPTAALLAAGRATPQHRERLAVIADEMIRSTGAGEDQTFVRKESAFLTALLEASKNEMFAALETPLSEGLILERELDPLSTERRDMLRAAYRQLADSITRHHEGSANDDAMLICPPPLAARA